jgi:hypothetical protein
MADSFLEIGTYNPDHNFNKIRSEIKVSVDPDPNAKALVRMTSDEYFKTFDTKYDLIFIDGLHEARQVMRDIENAYRCLRTERSVIVVHDVNPHSERITHVPRDSGEWCGDVYKAVSTLTGNKITVDIDYGCMIIFNSPFFFSGETVSWEHFDQNRKELLELISVHDFVKMF